MENLVKQQKILSKKIQELTDPDSSQFLDWSIDIRFKGKVAFSLFSNEKIIIKTNKVDYTVVKKILNDTLDQLNKMIIIS